MHSVTESFSQLPVDWLIVGCLAAALTVLTLRAGTRMASALALTVPVLSVASNMASDAIFLRAFASSATLILSSVLLIVLFFLIYRMLGQYMLSGAMPLKALLCGCGTTIVILIFIPILPGLSQLWHPGAQVAGLFGEAYRCWWLLVSYGAIAYANS